MKSKQCFLLATLAICLLPATARLKITNESYIDKITAHCSGQFPPVPISKKYPPNLDWRVVAFIIGGQEGNCDFYNGDKKIAHASLMMTPDASRAKILSFDNKDPKLKIDFVPLRPMKEPAVDISVTVHNKPVPEKAAIK